METRQTGRAAPADAHHTARANHAHRAAQRVSQSSWNLDREEVIVETFVKRWLRNVIEQAIVILIQHIFQKISE